MQRKAEKLYRGGRQRIVRIHQLPIGGLSVLGGRAVFFFASSPSLAVKLLENFPPAESFFLRRDADPVRFAVEGSRNRCACELRQVVLLREVRGDHVLKPAAIHGSQELRRRRIGEVAEAASDPVLELRGI